MTQIAPERPSQIFRRLDMHLGERSYPILIGQGLLNQAAQHIAPVLKSPKAVIIADEAVWENYGLSLQASLLAVGVSLSHILIPSGEESKSFARFEALLEQLLALPIDRNTSLIALGGGVVGDLTGFTASVALRGVPFIQVPTTLLAQVDSAVGGKTAINTQAGKNLVGSFYQPRLVLSDVNVLESLPERQRKAGYAEIIKYGLLGDARFYEWCLENGARILAGDGEALSHAIAVSCASKARIVEEDERESGARALLNLGHTFAHALEAETGFGDRLLHGEAVGIGMVLAAALSHELGLLADASLEAELATHFQSLGVRAFPHEVQENWDVERVLSHMYKDKKTERGRLNFVLFRAIGHTHVEKNVPAEIVLKLLMKYCRKP